MPHRLNSDGLDSGVESPAPAEAALRVALSPVDAATRRSEVALDPGGAASLVAWATSERVLGPVLAAVANGAFDLDDETMRQAVAVHQGSMLWCLQVELRLHEVRDWFEQAGGVEYLVVKGPAVAHLDEIDPSLRSFADLDLLIHERDMDRAIATLVEHHAVRRIPQRRPGFDRRFTKGVGLRCADGVEIDVHRTLCVGALGFRIPLDDLFADPDHFEIGGEWFAAPKPEHRALHAAYHALVGSPEPALRTVRDLAGYLTRPDLSPDVLVPEARSWGGETVLAEAVRATFATLSFEAPAWRTWLDGFTPNRRDLTLIERTRVESPWPIELSLLRELGWRERATMTWAIAFPSKEVLEDRGQSHWGRLRSGTRRLVRRR